MSIVGFTLIFSIPFFWLWNKGGLPYFWDMFSSYLLLYLQLNGDHEAISGVDRWVYLYESYLRFGNMQIFLMPIVLGIYIAFEMLGKSPSKIKLVMLLLTLLIIYSIYPVFAGQFWLYHWVPFAYFGSLCTSLLLSPISLKSSSLYRQVIPLVVFVIFLLTTIHPANDFIRQIKGYAPAAPKGGRVDEIANFLTEHLQPNDKVQPLDWTEGAVHAMLISEAPLATSYMHDYLFYHHISESYIQKVRARFMQQLRTEKPRFIIYMEKASRPKGEDTTTEFPEAEKFILENYTVVYEGNEFKILERIPALTIP